RLESAHHAHRLAVLGDQGIDLAAADAVLAGAGAVEGQRPMDQSLVQSLHLRSLLRVVWIEHDDEVEIAVTDVPEDWRYQEGSGDILLRLGDAFGQPRNRHADISCAAQCARA